MQPHQRRRKKVETAERLSERDIAQQREDGIVVGAGAAGAMAVKTLAKEGFNCRIVVIDPVVDDAALVSTGGTPKKLEIVGSDKAVYPASHC